MSDESPWAPPTPPVSSPTNSFGSVPPAFGTPVPVNNGARFWCAVLEVVLVVVTLFIGWIIWSVILYSKSTSPAKKIMGLHIVDVKTGAPATMQQMLLREVLGKWVLGQVTGGITGLISCILILATPNRQGVHDYIAKTTVARKP